MVTASLEDAERLAQWTYLASERTRRAKARVKKFADEHNLPAIPIGDDLEYRFVYGEAEEIVSKPELWAAIEAAVEYGHPFKREDHVRVRPSTKFEKRRKEKA